MSEGEDKLTVIFDFDGTLADTLELVVSIYNDNLDDFGSLYADINDLERYQKLGYKVAAKELRIRWHKIPKMALVLSREMKARMDEVEPFPGVIDVLHKLKSQGVSVGILTSNSHQLVLDFLKEHNFPEFDFIVSERNLFGKEKALKKIIKKYELSSDNVVYVGDEPRDIVASKKAGIKVIGVSWGIGGVYGLEPEEPNSIVNTPKELQREIDTLAK